MYDVTIESPIESPMVSPTILNSPGSRLQDQPYRGYLYPPKTNYIQVPMTWYNITSSVAPTAHFKLKPRPNTLLALSTHTLGQGLYFLGPMCMKFGNYNIGS
jgi:hypothetical protein